MLHGKYFLLLMLFSNTLLPQNKVLDFIKETKGNIIGYNYYDYLSGGGVGEKLIRFSDGTMIFGTMAAVDSALRTRGSYYNYFDGTKWMDTSVIWHRIEKNKRGWTQIAASYDKKTYTISHVGLELNENTAAPESPVWVSSIIPNTLNLAWPKIAADDNYLYVTAGTAEKNAGPFLRSTDAGITWEPVKYLIDTTSADYLNGNIYFSGDNTSIAARNGKVAVLNYSAYKNVTLFVSEDHGNTFISRTLYHGANIDSGYNAIPFDSSFYPIQTYKMTGIGVPDGTGDVHIDLQGRVHCAWANNEVGYYILHASDLNPIRDSLNALQRRFFVTDFSSVGISYWNSEIDPLITAVRPGIASFSYSLTELDSNGVPRIKNKTMDRALIGMPCMGSDMWGSMHMIFQGYKANDLGSLPGDTNLYPYNHAYVAATHGGLDWTTPNDVFDNVNGVDINYPVLPDLINGDLQLVYQIDESPGLYLQNLNHPLNKNYFVSASVSHILNEQTETNISEPQSFKLEELYPNPLNPFNPGTIVQYELPEESKVIIELYNTAGEMIKRIKNEMEPKGIYKLRLTFDDLASGVYFCRVTSISERHKNSVAKKLVYLK